MGVPDRSKSALEEDVLRFPLRYGFWLSVPPAVLLVPALLLVARTTLIPPQQRAWVLLVPIVAFIIGCTVYGRYLIALAGRAESAPPDQLSEEVSNVLQKTVLAGVVFWVGGSLLLALLGWLFVAPTFSGLQAFGVAAMLIAAPAMAQNYWAGKHLLLKTVRSSREFSYTGRFYSFRAKIAMVFIGFFLISAGAMVQLISARVAREFRARAFAAEQTRFSEIVAALSADPRAEAKRLAALPAGYDLHVVASDGRTSTGREELSATELARIVERRNGDSLAIGSESLLLFRQLPSGAIAVLEIPNGDISAITRSIQRYGLIIVFITAVFFAVATFFLARDLTAPVEKLVRVADAMADGNFETEVQVFSDDEIGRLSRSIAATRANLARVIGSVGARGSAVTSGVRAISGGTVTLLDGARKQSDLTERTRAAVEDVNAKARRVLDALTTVSGQATDSTTSAIELQASAEEIAHQMDALFRSVEQISSSSHQIDSSAREMSKRSELLSRINEEVVAFVAEMGATLEEFRRTAAATSDLSREVRDDAEGGRRAVEKTVEGIKAAQSTTTRTAEVLEELHGKVRRIDEVLLVIEELMNRTNLLALNAAIIAAQAGQHESGFSVVADEIRQLAERTRNATKEISTIVHSVQPAARTAVESMHDGLRQVDQTVQLAMHATASLEKIAASAEKSHGLAEHVSRSLAEQAKAAIHLNEVTASLSDHTRQIDRSIQGQASGTALLASESERVRDIALQVRQATGEQREAAADIASSMERVTVDVDSVREALQVQISASTNIATASSDMLTIARSNDGIAQQFNTVLQELVRSGEEFETEAKRFRVGQKG